MAASVLSQASALNPGSDLWIVPDLAKSQWTAKLDWYLNFQICKCSRHTTPGLPEFVNEVLAETELDRPRVNMDHEAPLMIASQSLLPNKWVVVVSWHDDMASWALKTCEIWQKLKQPSLRIFLPPGQSAGNFERGWSSHHSVQDFTVVLD